MNSHLKLPTDLHDYLGVENRIWDIGEELLPFAKLYTAMDAPEIKCTIRGPDYSGDCSGIDLVCDVGPHYRSAEGSLAWFPQFSEYGYWNSYQHFVHLYPGISLSDIIEHPSMYLMGHGIDAHQVFPYALKPWREEHRDDERCTALIACARSLCSSRSTFPRALKAALLATELGRDVSAELRKMADYLAGRLVNEIRNREDVVHLCDSMLESISLSPSLGARLEDEAARSECNSGNEFAAVARLERLVTDKRYSEFHERFNKILKHIKQRPFNDEQ